MKTDMNNSNENLREARGIALQTFKERLNGILKEEHTDAILMKWLKAKNFDVNAAEKMFRRNYNNRILFGINTILDTYEKPEVAEKYETIGILGFAKDGSLIQYTGAGRLDFYGFLMSMSCNELCVYFSYWIEYNLKLLKEENSRTGRKVNEITFVIDLEGFHYQQVLHKCVIEMGLDFTSLFQDCYPELWSYILIVNAPEVFEKAFNLFKPVLGSNILERITIANKDSSKKLLLKHIDEDVLPVFLGGKKTDSSGNPECTEFIKFGGKVPECWYSQNRRPLLQPTDPGVRVVTVRPRSVVNIIVVLREGGQTILIEGSCNGSTTTSVYYRKFTDEDGDDPKLPGENEYLGDNDEYKRISVAIRAQLHCTPLNTEIFLPEPGIYVFTLSNMSNWFTSRKGPWRHRMVETNPALKKCANKLAL